jgi:hypothetical protein
MDVSPPLLTPAAGTGASPASGSTSPSPSPRTAAAPLWVWKRAGAPVALGDAPAGGSAALVVPGGLFSSSPRRSPSRDVLEARAEHASAKKTRLLTAAANALKGIDEGRRARARAARMKRLSGSASARHALRKAMQVCVGGRMCVCMCVCVA